MKIKLLRYKAIILFLTAVLCLIGIIFSPADPIIKLIAVAIGILSGIVIMILYYVNGRDGIGRRDGRNGK